MLSGGFVFYGIIFYMKNTSFVSLALVALLLFAVPLAFAQEASGVKIQPAILEDRVEPGEAINSVLRVTNFDPLTQDYSFVVRDIEGISGEGEPLFAEGDALGPYGLRSWVSVGVSSVSVRPGETKEVPFFVRVPADASPGAHLGGVFLVLKGARPGDIGTGIGYEVGTILSLRVSGEVREEARIREFRSDRNMYSALPVSFGVRVENLGNVLVRARGPLEVKNMFGKKVATLVMNPEAAAVFPGADREFAIVWESDEFAFGRYQATMALAYGEDGRKTLSASLSFWVLPVKALGLVIGGLILLVLIFFFGARWYIRRRLHELEAATLRMSGASGTSALSARPPFSRLLFVTLALLLFVLVLLLLLFFLFG